MEKKMSKYRIVAIVFGALSLLAFFFIPCYHNSLISSLGAISGMMGTSMEGGEIANLTAFQLVCAGFGGGGVASYMGSVGNSILFLIPAALSLAAIVFAVIGKKMGSIGMLICSAVTLIVYFIQLFSVGIWGMAGFRISFLYYLVFAFDGVILAMAIVELRKNLARARAGADSKSWNWSASDPDMTEYNGNGRPGGMSAAGAVQCVKGEYRGAVLSVANGERLTIGRSAADCNLVLSDPAVSRVHCYVAYFADRGIYGVTDVSKHGVYDGHGTLIEKNQMVYMASGDEIRIGQTGNVFQFK